MSFHFFVSFSISFINILFSEYRSFTSLVNFIPRYFPLFDVIVNRIVFLPSLSDSSFLVYRKATDFWTLILYLTTLLNSFISSHRFLVETLGSSIYSIMSSAKSDSFTSSLPIRMPFISFSCLIVVARTSNTVLNKSGKSGHPCLFVILEEIFQFFSPLSMMLAVGLS